MSSALAAPEYAGDLGDGLVRRWSTAADLDKIAHCMATVFRGDAGEPLSPVHWARMELAFNTAFPLMGAGDCAVVEDTSHPDRPIVATACLWRQRWSYGGIDFGIGRPEYIATRAEYRNRGLIRGLMEMLHARSAECGDLVQAITGIPYYYRQFGYEYALDLWGIRRVYLADISPAGEGQQPEYRLRPALEGDTADLLALYNQRRAGSLVWCETDEAYWQYNVAAGDLPPICSLDPVYCPLVDRPQIIVDTAGTVCGYVAPEPVRRGTALTIYDLELYPHVNWQRVMPDLLRELAQLALNTPQRTPRGPGSEPAIELAFNLGRTHPAYEVLGTKLAARYEPPDGWYVRVPDVPAFLQHIGPVLEARLASSLLVGYSGDLKIDFYRGGLRLAFDQGKLKSAEPWQEALYGDECHAHFPPLIFLQLVFGYRSLDDLYAYFQDVWPKDEARLLLNTLFPKQPSWVQEMCII
ncbi:MAG: GNAT family N-acetyltransferase [Caldilineaceae bacterium]